MTRKKVRANNPRKNISLNTEKNAVFTAERYSVFAEEAIQFTVNGRNILMERKRGKKERSVNPPVMKDVTPFRQKNKRKIFFAGKSAR
ncbi:hypothetical protein TNCV_363841 [Trichonephila clavipes]|uniref:Uncharacterized protein n=1 Tax=Trichonephila clavipes TaxID=2585209 RepID=A0A8X6SH04_TRICX|nr:hypothetical protein TNCV_363841 [Trichonephila clavipes]